MRNGTTFDACDIPEGEWSEEELLLWEGKCPDCAKPAVFSPSEYFDGSWICRYCLCEFKGPELRGSGTPPVRKLDAVYKRGEEGKLRKPADQLFPVTARGLTP